MSAAFIPDTRWPLSPYTDDGLEVLRRRHAQVACYLILHDADGAARDSARQAEAYEQALHDRLKIRWGLL